MVISVRRGTSLLNNENIVWNLEEWFALDISNIKKFDVDIIAHNVENDLFFYLLLISLIWG